MLGVKWDGEQPDHQPLPRPDFSGPCSSKSKEGDPAVIDPCPSTPAVSWGARGPGELGNGQTLASTPASCLPLPGTR